VKITSRQLGRSTQRLITIPKGVTLGVGTAPTPEAIETDLPPAIDIAALGTINRIAESWLQNSEIGVALQRIFGHWLTVLESIIVPAGPTWHLIEGPIELPYQPYRDIDGLTEEQSILGLGRANL